MWKMYNSGITCCKNCHDRKLKCHSTCEAYHEELEEHRKQKAVYRQGKEYRDYTCDHAAMNLDISAKKKKTRDIHGRISFRSR